MARCSLASIRTRFVNFNPHVHVLAADGAFLPDGRFVTLPTVPGSLLAEGFRRAVLEFLVNNDALSEGLRSRMLGWRHSGFSAHNEVRVPPILTSLRSRQGL
jgi:hypothetical protein